jgi:hypothetical protein
MLNVSEILRNRKVEIAAERIALDNEEAQIDYALDAIAEKASKYRQPPTGDEMPLKKEDAVVEAVKHGQKRPADIHKFLTKKMGVEMNLGSVRSTLSRLKSENRIKHDASGWVM